MNVTFRRFMVGLVTVSLTGCNAGFQSIVKSSPSSGPSVGPLTSSQIEQRRDLAKRPQTVKLDVAIPVFDPGLSTDASK